MGFPPAAQLVLRAEEAEDRRAIRCQLGVARQITLDPSRVAPLDPVLQVNVDQLDQRGTSAWPCRKEIRHLGPPLVPRLLKPFQRAFDRDTGLGGKRAGTQIGLGYEGRSSL